MQLIYSCKAYRLQSVSLIAPCWYQANLVIMLLRLKVLILLSFIRGCLHEKTHTGASFLPTWFFDFIVIAFTWWLGHFTSRFLKVHFMLIKCMCDSKSRILRMRYLFQSTSRQISHRNRWSFGVYVVVQFYPWFKFLFSFVWGIVTVIYDNDFQTKENKI